MNRLGLAVVIASVGAGSAARAQGVAMQLRCTQNIDHHAVEVTASNPLPPTGYALCEVIGKDPRGDGATATLRTSWHVGGVVANSAVIVGSTLGDGKTFGFDFSMTAPRDWAPCATDVVAAIKVVDAKQRVLFETTHELPTACPAGGVAVATPPPAARKAPAPADTGLVPVWDESQRKQLPVDALPIIDAWLTIFHDDDAAALTQEFPNVRVAIGKKTLGLKQLAGALWKTTNVMPNYQCKHPEQQPTDPNDCSWATWQVELKSKTEVWIYNTDGTFYGPYPSLVFKKTGKTWAWVAVKSLDKGEP